jgi:DNA repair protein RadD
MIPAILPETRWYQEEAEFAVFDYFERGNVGNPVVCMPTGTGKSHVIANLIRRIFWLWPTQRVMMLTHVKQLIVQNAEKLLQAWPTAPLGVHSAGLNSRDIVMPIIFGGVQSVANVIKKSLETNDGRAFYQKHFGHRDLVFVDECHLISPEEDTEYQYVIAELKKINPYLKVIGFTATPYRMRQGMITDGGLFTDICYDITGVESFNRLIYEGYISPLVPKPTVTEIDISNVGISRGDFNKGQLEAAVDKDEITYSAVSEMVNAGQDRRSWLVFSAGIDNAEHIAAMFQMFGVQAAAVHSKLKDSENDERIRDYKNGALRCLVTKDKLTTGFDDPKTDMIGVLRHTLSPGLWVQLLGRGTRPSWATGKENCLVLDFARNTPRLGPINDPRIPQRPGKGGGDAPIRICDCCKMYNHAAARFCGGGRSPEEGRRYGGCGNEFVFENKIFAKAGEALLIRPDDAVIEYFDVKKVIYNLHEKKNANGVLTSPPMIKVSYFCGFQMFNEYIMLEHNGMPGKKSRDWWRQRHSEEPPMTTHEALRRVSELRSPARIRVHVNKKYPEILSAEW